METKLKVFISQPMRDRDKEEIIKERQEIERYLNIRYNNNVEIIDSYKSDFVETDKVTLLKLIANCIEMMADADLVVFANNWQYARGCRIERRCAEEYGLMIFDF